MSFTLKHPAALDRVRTLFAQAKFLDHVGLKLVDVGPGWAQTEVLVRPHHGQSEGFVHAGMQATMADHSSGTAAGTLIAPDQTVLAVEFKVTLLRPAAGERLTCRAEVLRAGRRLMFTEAKLFAHKGSDARLVATFNGTVAVASLSDLNRG